MAAKGKAQKGSARFTVVHKLLAAVSLLSFFVVLVVGLRADADVYTIAYRACAVMLVIKLVSIVVIRALSTYEEINRGKA
jgi:hypothetical protein